MLKPRLEKIKSLISEEFNERHDFSLKNPKHTVGWPLYDENEIFSALDCLLDLRLSQGDNVKKFEKAYKEYLKLPADSSAIAVNSGSSANLVAFASLIDFEKLSMGDEVIVPASTFATVSSILYQLGLVPVYVDSELETWNLDPKAIESAISKKTRAIMVVHNLGIPAQMDEIMEIASKNNLLVIEDCCEAHGSYYRGKQVGSIGDMATLSFFVAHNITTGEGGMIFCKDKTLTNKLRSVREFGRAIDYKDRYHFSPSLGEYDSRYIFETLGYNVRMTDFAAAMGLVQLQKLETLNKTRRANAKILTSIISEYSDFLSTINPSEDTIPGYYGFPIYVNPNGPLNRNDLCKHLEKFNIETRPNMGGCLPDQPGFKDRKHVVSGKLKNSRLIRENAMFIGIHSGLNQANFENFAKALKSIYCKV